MKKRNATAVWTGPGKTGKGNVSTQSGLLKDSQYSYSSRFEEGTGTNPEELVAAAHAGCFSMKLSFVLGAAGFEPTSIETTCTVTLDNGKITNSHLNTVVKADGVSEEVFNASVADAKENCPISKSLNTDITIESKLN